METREFKDFGYTGMKRLEFPSTEAFDMYRKVIKKYEGTDQQILVCLRDKDDQLMRSELLNYNSRGTFN